MSAARKFGTVVRTHTPSVSGTRKTPATPASAAGRRCSAKNSRRNVLARASTLATEATTPSFTSSVIRISRVGHPINVSLPRAAEHLIFNGLRRYCCPVHAL